MSAVYRDVRLYYYNNGRDPSKDDFKKCRRHPQGKEAAKKRFGSFSAFEKGLVVPGTGIEKIDWINFSQARCLRAPEG